MGMPLPQKFIDKPKLTPGLEFYWRAFWELSTCRAIGMSEGPVPWTAMDRYALRYELEEEDFDRFVLIMKGMDIVYIKIRDVQRAKASKPVKKPKKMRSR
jgi:hypothetical protein